MAMTYASKYRASRIASLLAILVIAYCFFRAIPPGIGGEVHIVKIWLGVAFLASAAGIACAVTTYYFRAKSQAQNTGKDTVAILGAVGSKHSKQAEVSPSKARQKSV